MNILLLTSDFLPNIGGMASHALELARAHVQNGHRLELVHPVHGAGEDHIEEMEGFIVHKLFVNSQTPKWKHVLYIRKVRDYVRKLHAATAFDVLHWHDLTPNCWSTWTLRNDLPLVWTNHTSNYLEMFETGVGRTKIKLFLGHADAIISPSRELYEKSTATGIDPKRNFYIPNGVDAAKFRPDNSFGVIDKDYAIDPARPVIVCPRRLEPKNGVEYFIRAVPLVRAEMPEVQFLIVGGGFPDERKRFEGLLREAGEARDVFFTGNVPNSAMPKFYALSTIAALPSLMEATSISGLEAMASGLPLVGTNIGGIPEIIEDGESGLLVEARSPEQLAQAFLRLLRDADLRRRLGEGARRRVEAVFAWPEIARRTTAIYDVAAAHWKSRH
ncbi:MAG: glycosyltransferase family 4 protein [Bacteroidetes bacterium]|nr:glycosyltransferase family 4 protein [Bacteroidota bacterium]